MLGSIPVALLTCAWNGDPAALESLCALLWPDVRSLFRVTEPWRDTDPELRSDFRGVVQGTLALPQIRDDVARALEDAAATPSGAPARVEISGLALARFLIELRDVAVPTLDDEDPDRPAPPEPSATVVHVLPTRERDAVVGTGGAPDAAAPPLSVYVDLSCVTPDEVVEILVGLSDLFRAERGDGLVIRNVGALEPALLAVGA